ncbi:DUF6531 domain-containing protein [Microbacterium sp. HMH0099]|uniref:DUF6531 domain-containing protein n=1 Tax=Microbacterium sp. HMH0099 TaxID=3414026 RepID=UPI003BF628A4
MVDVEIGGAADLTYDFGAADAVASAARAAAWAVDGQAGSRASFAKTAGEDFEGRFARLFAANAATAVGDAREVAQRLRDVATFVGRLSEAAREENSRRRAAREWRDRVQARRANMIDAAWDGFFGEEPPPTTAPVSPPRFSPSGPRVRARQTPTPGGGGSGGGTSSARPDRLRAFAAGVASLDATLAAHPARLAGAASDFMACCDFGGIDVGPVVAGFRAWLDANAQDASWANTIAQAFEDAGAAGGVGTVSDAALEASLAAAGVSASREDLVIDPPTAWGGVPTTGFVNDPVNSATGNFVEPETDLVFAGPDGLLSVTRMYNSLDDGGGVFGPGWWSLFDITLVLGDDQARFVQADGREVVFGRDGHGWARAAGESFWLERAASAPLNGWRVYPSAVEVLRVTDNTGRWWAFDTAGVWLGAGRGTGDSIRVLRNENGSVTSVTHSRGRSVAVEYVGGRVGSVTASDGRRREYVYDGAHRLIGVTGPTGTRSYRWNEDDLIDRVVSAAGVVECVNVYDTRRRVREQLTAFGRRTRFSYLPGRVTEVADVDGGNANTWIADRKGRLVGIVDAAGCRQSMGYDPHGGLVSVTDREGRVTVHAYDDRGRRIRTLTAEGADLTFGYDQHDRVTTVVTATGGEVRYDYANDTDRDPSRITDPCGGVTHLTWVAGLLVRVEDPMGTVVRFEYDEHGELIATRNADGAVARVDRDAAGRVVRAISPSGATTHYTYDSAGTLTSREDPDGGVWRFEHGPGEVLTAVIDPLGGRTEHSYGPHGQLTGITDPLGRTVHREFDTFGNVSAVTLPDGAAWGFAHDALSRLREITDPAGGVWSREYDPNGELAATVDPTGVRVELVSSPADATRTVRSAFEQATVRFDVYGRPERIQDATGAASLITYDPCGRPVEILDADGGLTRIERDLAGRVTAVTSPAGRRTVYEYDRCGRPIAAMDPAGARTALEYDADSRVIARILPTGERAETVYDVMGRVTVLREPGVGVARYGYDRLGRVVLAHDTRYGIRRFAYDPAGQLITATNGLGGVTRYDYDDRGRLTTVTDPAGGVTTRTYTATDKVASVTDPLGRTTRATYDDAGRQLTQTAADGTVTQWGYDEAGRESSLRIDGRPVSETHRDAGTRTVTITDHTTGRPVVHTLRFTRLGQLAERTTTTGGGYTGAAQRTRWEYDADGARTRLTTSDGVAVDYTRDAAGRLIHLDHSRNGAVHYTRDAFGRLLTASAGDAVHSWTYTDGYPTAHTLTGPDGVIATRIIRDDSGRITALHHPHGTTRYTHDDAGQLRTATTTEVDSGADETRRRGEQQSEWDYDEAGRLTRESTREGHRLYTYDIAGQLLTATHGEDLTAFAYDAQGRRTRESTPGRDRQYTWDQRGWVRTITHTTPTGERRLTLHVDALGELADIDHTVLTWDTAASVSTPLTLGDHPVIAAPGGFTGIDGHWGPTAWRDIRTTIPEDPWHTLHAVTRGAVGLTAHGGIHVDGLEWLGARAYDPATRGFLSTDPLAAPAGTAWSANPYSYAGNDPLHSTDPLGLQPVTDADLRTYAHNHQGALGNMKDWADENPYLVGGVALGFGAALMFFGGPVGAVVGGALFSAGTSILSQKTVDGSVDWGRVGCDSLVGAVGGGAGGLVASSLARAGTVARSVALANAAPSQTARVAYNVLGNTGTRAAIAGAADGAASNVTDYTLNSSEHSIGGYVQALATGTVTGAGSSLLMTRLGGPLSNMVGSKLTPTWTAPPSLRSHGGAPVNWGQVASEHTLNHVAGAAAGYANPYIQPGEPEDSAAVSSAIQGLVKGAAGPSSSLR